jgi:tetratricopeptide (TPR) repeat protein
LRWSSRYYTEEDHGTVPLLAEYDALHFIFSSDKLPAFEHLLDSSFDAIGAIREHFDKASKQMGYTVLPPEPFVNQLGYAFLQNKRFDKAKTFFEMNVTNYPDSFNVYDSMGDCYAAKGDNQKAIEFYSKALSLRDYPETRQKMEKLKITK